MRTKYDFIIGIDPDVDKSGFALLDVASRSMMAVDAFDFAHIAIKELPLIAEKVKTSGKNIAVVVEASWMISGNWHLTHKGRKEYAAATGYKVGCNHQVGKLIVEMCKAYGIPVVEHIPLHKCWSGKDGKITHYELTQFCPVDKTRTNQEMRDAALLAWCFADFPIRLKSLPSRKG